MAVAVGYGISLELRWHVGGHQPVLPSQMKQWSQVAERNLGGWELATYTYGTVVGTLPSRAARAATALEIVQFEARSGEAVLLVTLLVLIGVQ